MLRRSPAFHRQWQRMLCAARLAVGIELVHAHRVLNAQAATAVSTLPDGSVLAVVAIPGGLRRAGSGSTAPRLSASVPLATRR